MKPINEQINAKFVIQAKRLAYFTRLLHGVLPVECQQHVEVANIRNQNLMLITDSPVWTTRLRQLSPQILQFIRKNTPNDDINKEQIIHHIQISTRYKTPNSEKQQSIAQKRKQKLQISDKTATMLSQSADSIQHQQLKTALLRLARHSRDHDTGEKGK